MSDTNQGFVRAVIPMLVCADAGAEIEFCKAAFGAVEVSRRSAPDGTVIHAALRVGEAMVMVHCEIAHLASVAPQLDGSSPVVIYIYLGDVDATIERSVVAGAKVLLPAADQFWGDRVGRIMDPAGHVWNVTTRFEATASG